MIVRNLSFKADEAALREAFEPFGRVVDVQVPLREGGKHPGFGFVQMSSKAECEAAMAELNESTILKRMVAGGQPGLRAVLPMLASGTPRRASGRCC